METQPLDPMVAQLVSQLDQGCIEFFNERAAIREYDAGMSREHAEAMGLLDVVHAKPLALSRVVVLEIELDGATQWLLSADAIAARQHLVDIGAKEIGEFDLVEVLREQYGCAALLTTLG